MKFKINYLNNKRDEIQIEFKLHLNKYFCM